MIEVIKKQAADLLERMKFRRTFEKLYDGFVPSLGKQESFELESEGMYIADIFTALEKHPKAKEYFGQICPVDYEKGATLHYANMLTGVFVYVEANVEVTEAVVLNEYALGHRLLVVEDGAKVTFVDDVSGKLSVTELKVGADASVDFVSAGLSNEVLIDTKKAVVEAGGSVHWKLCNFGSEKAYTTVQSHIVGEAGNSDISWVFYTRESQQMDYFAGNIFDAKNCTGEILSKAVGADTSKSSFVGEIDITLQGGGTDSYLKEEVLMLDATSKVDAIPSLEIKTNDVKAGHGVSISKITDEHLFYLMSRGVSRDKARELVLDGFLRSVYNEFGVESLVERISEYLEASYA